MKVRLYRDNPQEGPELLAEIDLEVGHLHLQEGVGIEIASCCACCDGECACPTRTWRG